MSSPENQPTVSAQSATAVTAVPDELFTDPSSRRRAETVPLKTEYGPLPPGALLHKRRYVIKQIVSQGKKINVYEAEEDVDQRVCPQCGETRNGPRDGYCTRCGVALGETQVTRPVWLIKESAGDRTFQAESRVARLGLSHANIVALHDTFSHRSYGPEPRYYLVMEKVETVPLVQLPPPHDEQTVLSWGIQLAQALQYLHQNHVLHRRVRVENIVVEGDRARFTNFNTAEVLEGSTLSLEAEGQAKDVRELTQVLHFLLTGQDQFGKASVPPSWARVLNRAVGLPEQQYHAAAALLADLEAIAAEKRRPASSMFQAGRLSHVGRVRELNEDSLLTLEVNRVVQSQSQPLGIYIVADGMGGHQGGEVASAMATQIVGRRLLEEVVQKAVLGEAATVESMQAEIKEAILLANQQIRKRAQALGNDMGTTIVVALVAGNEAIVANVGDSRAYVLDEHSIKQISVDHSLIQMLIDLNRVTPDEAKTHPKRSAIYRVLGDKPSVEIDTTVHRFQPGERLLLCSDGLNGMIDDNRIHQLVITIPDPQDACQALVEAANAAGGEDNVTVVLVKQVAG